MGFVKAMMRMFRGENSQPAVVLLSIRSISQDEFCIPQVKNSVRLLPVPTQKISGYQAINSAPEQNSDNDTFKKTIPTEKHIPPFATKIIPATVETTPVVGFSSILVDCDKIYKIKRDELIKKRDGLEAKLIQLPDNLRRSEEEEEELCVRLCDYVRRRDLILELKAQSPPSIATTCAQTQTMSDEEMAAEARIQEPPRQESVASDPVSVSQACEDLPLITPKGYPFNDETKGVESTIKTRKAKRNRAALLRRKRSKEAEKIWSSDAASSEVLPTSGVADEPSLNPTETERAPDLTSTATIFYSTSHQISEAILPEDLPISAIPQMSDNPTVTESVLATEDPYVPHVIPVLAETEGTPDSTTDKDPIYDIISGSQPNQPSVPNVNFIHVTNLPVSLPGQTLVWYLETLVGPVKCCTMNLDENHLYCGKTTVLFRNPGDAIRAFLFCQPMVIERHEIEIELVVNEKRLSPSEAMAMYPKIQFI